MKRANYKARVIFDQDRDAYIVEAKRNWWSKWELKHSATINNYSSKVTAERAAIEACNALTRQIVVYESCGDQNESV